jgi:mannose-6-phosphate isomerase-like protein (cupin superfamily)
MHCNIPAGSSIGSTAKPDMSEAYYVLGGDGTVTIGTETAAIHTGDVVPVRLNERPTFTSTGREPIEFMIIGVAKHFAAKDALMAASRPSR